MSEKKTFKAILGRKVGMTQLFDKQGNVVPLTVIESGPCPIVQKKTKDRDGYYALQLGFGSLKIKKLSRPQSGHFAKGGTDPTKFLKEIKVKDEKEIENLNPGDFIIISGFKEGDLVKVTGTSRGMGFAGTVKRHHFGRGPMSHGSKSHRLPGSIGAGTSPGHIVKGKRMAGHMGNEKVTQKNLKVIKVEEEKNLLFLRGSVPGVEGSLVVVEKISTGG